MYPVTGGILSAVVDLKRREIGLEGIEGQGEGSGAGRRWPLSSRLALAALAAYGILLWVSRPATPFEWDEVLAQRAVLRYDVANHSPQPPGFPAYIGAAKAVNLVTRNPLLALQVVGIVAALSALAATWALARRMGAPPAAAAAAAALLGASPEFLYSAAVGISDVSGTSAAVAAALALVAAAERPALLPLAGAACGVLAGIRPQSGAVLVPALVWAVAAAVRGRRWRGLALAGLSAAAVAAASWVPAILVTGPQRWWSATTWHVQYMATVERTRHLPGARLGDLASWWLSGSVFGWGFAIPLWALVIAGTVVLVRTGRGRLAALAGGAVALHLVAALFTMNETVSLRYILPALPFMALLAGGALAAPSGLVRRTAAAVVTLWCLAAVAWTSPALIERRQPGPVWAALSWVKEHYDPATTRVVFDGVATPQVQYVLGRAGFQIMAIERANAFLLGPAPPGEQTLYVTPGPVPGAQLLFEAHHRTRRIVQLAWGRYGSCAVSRVPEAGAALFSPEWQVRKDGWQLWGTGRIELRAEAKPAVVRLCAGGEAITLRRPGWPAEAIAPGRCVMAPLLPGAGGALAVSAPPDSVALIPPIQVLPLAALDASSGLASAYMVPQVAHVAGYGGALWRTDLVLFNPQAHPVAVTAQFLATGRDNQVAPTVSGTLAPGQVLDVPDVLALRGFRAAGTVGALLLHATAGGSACASAGCDFLALARTYNARAIPGLWRASEWLPGVAAAQALRQGDTAVFSHVTRSGAVGASVGVASWSDTPVRVEVRVLGPGGGVVETRTLELARFGHAHVPLAADVAGGKVEVELVGAPAGAIVVPYVSLVDRGSGLPAHALADTLPRHVGPAGWVPPYPAARAER